MHRHDSIVHLAYLDAEMVCLMDGDVYKDGGVFNLLPTWSVQVDMTITCHQPKKNTHICTLSHTHACTHTRTHAHTHTHTHTTHTQYCSPFSTLSSGSVYWPMKSSLNVSESYTANRSRQSSGNCAVKVNISFHTGLNPAHNKEIP